MSHCIKKMFWTRLIHVMPAYAKYDLDESLIRVNIADFKVTYSQYFSKIGHAIILRLSDHFFTTFQHIWQVKNSHWTVTWQFMKKFICFVDIVLNTHEYFLKVVPTLVEDNNGQRLANPFQYTFAYRVSYKRLLYDFIWIQKTLVYHLICICWNIPAKIFYCQMQCDCDIIITAPGHGEEMVSLKKKTPLPEGECW